MKYGNNVWPGDVTIESEEDAYRYQIKIEDSFQKQLGFRLKTGDIIMTHFDTERLRLHRGPQEGADQGEGAAGEKERVEMSEEISKKYC